jgi:hypothetical protein
MIVGALINGGQLCKRHELWALGNMNNIGDKSYLTWPFEFYKWFIT